MSKNLRGVNYQYVSQQSFNAKSGKTFNKINVVDGIQGLRAKESEPTSTDGGVNPIIAKANPKDVPRDLIHGFVSGKKNPVMAFNEFCQLQRLNLTFEEVAPEGTMGIITCNYAMVAIVDGTRFPQGKGRTKKDAKAAASRIAMRAFLGMDDEEADRRDAKGAREANAIVVDDEPIAPRPRRTFGASAPSDEPLVHGGGGGHYQMKYESARLPSKDMWKVPEKQESFMEYQLRKQAQPNQQMAADSSGDNARSASGPASQQQAAPSLPTNSSSETVRVPQSVPMAARAWSGQPRMPSQPGPGLSQTNSVPQQQQQLPPSTPTQQQHMQPSALTFPHGQVQQDGGYSSSQLDVGGTSRVADNIASVARNIPRVGPPFPGSASTGLSPSYAAFVMKLGDPQKIKAMVACEIGDIVWELT